MECMPNRESLLALIQPGMKLTKDFLKRIYGYGVTDGTFPDKAIAALEAAGCSKARQYYSDWVTAYEEAYKAEIQPVGAWYRQECGKGWARKQKEGEEKRKQLKKENLQQMNNEDLIALLESLTGGI